ncbi:MAG: ADP-heptose--LPS heptosyltransferase [Ignavibacteriales bacterium CG_4_9_14_3_um_filter_30_11]|nr:MAG: ADP-heptose--LPS heptosyltransferase [Ignavibacteriales bacterium CG_4_9_14_3_um_filter_30_11]
MINPRILITRTDRIGDVVLSTPLPRSIKRQYPESYVAVLVKKYTKDLYLNNPFVDKIIISDEENLSFLKLALLIRKMNFTHSMSLIPTERINWLLFWCGIKKRIGVGNKFYQFITNAKSVYRNKYVPLRHESDYCLDHVRKNGIESIDLNEEIFLTETEISKSGEIKRSICKSGEYLVGINTTSGNSAPNLSLSEYIKLINILIKIENIKIVITDTKPSVELKEIENIYFINTNNKLRESIINFAALDLLISSSTGPMHICAGLKIKTLSLFCPLIACSPKLWGPNGNESHIILPKDNYCSNICPGDPKLCDFSGDGGINAEMIIDKIKTLLNL